MQFIPTIDLGTIVQILVLIFGILQVTKKLGEIETKVETMWTVFIKDRE